MSNKNKKLGLGIAAVAAAGAGLVYAAQNMKRTAKAFIIPTETMKHLPGQRNRKVSMTKMHTLSEADLQHSQRLVSLSETVRCRVPIFIF